jgi:adenosylcobinamide-GDP ribazoletransferase
MRRELRLFFTALTFLTRLPGMRWADNGEESLRHAVRYFPLVGVVVGGVAAAVYWLAAKIWPQELAVLASMAASLWVTGAFHEDGLSDATDGLGGGWEKEHVLTIMKDSRVGSFGAIALMMALLTKFVALTHIPVGLVPAVLVAGHALSRLAVTLVIHAQHYVRDDGKAKPLATRLGAGERVLAAVFGLTPLGLLPAASWWAVLPVALVWWWFSRLLLRRLGGYTGDCLGAMQQLCELAFYLGVAAWTST